MINFWHPKLALNVQFWHFLTNCHYSWELFKVFSFVACWFLAKKLAFQDPPSLKFQDLNTVYIALHTNQCRRLFTTKRHAFPIYSVIQSKNFGLYRIWLKKEWSMQILWGTFWLKCITTLLHLSRLIIQITLPNHLLHHQSVGWISFKVRI